MQLRTIWQLSFILEWAVLRAFKSINLFARFDVVLAWRKETAQCKIELGLDHDGIHYEPADL
jgi:hypothetical protein